MIRFIIGMVVAAALATPAQDINVKQVQAEEPSIYIGEFTVTAYCPGSCCNDSWAGQTASGIPAGPGIVAVDPDVIPLDSTVIIDGTEYLAADTGGSIKGSRIDICMESHTAALDYGVQEKGVWLYLCT